MFFELELALRYPVAMSVFKDRVIFLGHWSTPDNPEALLSELMREVSFGHPLFQKRLEVFAQSLVSDDVIYKLLDEVQDRYALVHLTWKGSEKGADLPSTSFASSYEVLMRKAMI
jgi:hypothetical protein